MALFLVLGVVGLVVIVVSLVLGDLHGGALDALGADWFSTEVVGGFVSALGFGGAIAVQSGASDGLAVAVGVLAGIVFGAGAAWLTRLVRGGATDHTPDAADVVGQEGKVLSAVPEGGYGSVEVRLGGHTLRFNARADLPLDAGTQVHVTSVLSPTAVTVSPLWSALPPSG
ncbi:NfeD family protein [Nocardioides sp.]|uniref:NfeD family protein n=1 Tax=Nocardioides sp. TaxID=35761 RepID=UPI0027202B3F|nr:NfeD family protein [Nocardioides sp.]MDO9456363.1 NfeD family protein [Nocardioides sp.]